MSNLGNKFFEPLETLEGEKIVWEGGPSKRGFRAQLLDGFLRWLGILLAILVFIGFILFSVSVSSSNEYKETKQNLKQENVTTNPEITIDNGNQENKKTTKFPAREYGLIVVTMILVFILIIILTSFIMIRFYWYVITNERICIQSGFIQRKIITIDLDKVISIKSSQSVAERLLGLNSIELVHAGVTISGNYRSLFNNPNRIRYLDLKNKIASILIKHWLPRDNKKR